MKKEAPSMECSLDTEADSYVRVEYVARRYNIKMDQLEKIVLINNITDKDVAMFNQ